MGINDKVTPTLTCPKCNAVEGLAAYESGSRFGAACGGFRSERFTVVSDDGKYGPSVRSATCNKCGFNAAVR